MCSLGEMPPEDSSTSTPTGEPTKTPEGAFDTGSAKSAGDRNGNRFVFPPTAPKGKPRAPPLIHGKIKPNETDVDISNESSKIPLLKSKHVDSEFLTGADDRKKHRNLPSTSSMGNRSSRSINSEGSSGIGKVHRTVEKVKLSKGIEMKRVVQETNGIKTKRFSSTTIVSKTKASVPSTKESSHHTANATSPHRRKMTKTEASFAGDVKSFMPHHMDPPRPSGSSSSLTNVKSKIPPTTHKHEQLSETGISIKKPPCSKEKETQPEVENGHTQETPMDVGDFKTVDEFLNMPETCFPKPDPKTHFSDGRKKMYKSKFWEYIDPNNKNRSPSKGSKDKGKTYDPEVVKTFMQKQKESRRQQHLKETREKEEESAKRQRMLKELESKYQRQRMLKELEGKYQRQHKDPIQTHKNKQTQKNRGDGSFEASDVNVSIVAECRTESMTDLKAPNQFEAQSPSMKYLKPLLERKHSTLLTMRKSSEIYSLDVAKQSQYLLTEFENIVKRECISFLQKIPIPPTSSESNTNNMDGAGAVQKVDKAVATSNSLLDLATYSLGSESQSVNTKDGSSPGSLSSKEWSSKDFQSMGEVDFEKRPPSRRKVRSPNTVENAVKKIQAVYRGYKVRQALKEANLCFPRQPAVHKRCSQLQNPNRRWSFPKMPEKPYAENLSSRLMPMSPIPMVGISSDSAVPCYIPPPAGSAGYGPMPQRSPSKPRVLPTFPLTPVRFRYNDPYPRSATLDKKSTSSLDSVNGNVENLPPPPNLSFITMRPKKGEEQELPVPFENLAPKNFTPSDIEFAVPSSLPSIVDVLREKLRLYQQTNEGEGVAPSMETPQGKELGIRRVPAGDVSTSAPEDGVTPKIKRHKRRSRPRSQSQKSPVADSSTTVDTDGEYVVPTATRSSGSLRTTKKSHHHVSSNGSKSEQTISSVAGSGPASSTTFDDATCTTSTFGNYLEPALRLRYEAERERLKTIEKALQVRLEGKTEENNTASKKSSPPEVDRVQLAIANCHKESMKAATEMAKWMSEFQKTSREPVPQQQQQTVTPVDLAATVYAAVEQARIMGIEKRREKEKKTRQQHHHKTRRSPETTASDKSEILSKVDKSCETSLILVGRPAVVGDKGKRRGGFPIDLKDHQQQFPSESESPVPTVTAVNTLLAAKPPRSPAPPRPLSLPVEEDEDNTSESKFFQDPVDYPSIIPSGNSIEFTSLDPRVSTLEYISQLSTEEKGYKEAEEEDLYVNGGDDTFVDEEEVMSTSVPKEDDIGSSLVSRQSTIADDTLSQQQSKSIEENISVEEDDQLSNEIEQVEDEAEYPSVDLERISTQSKIEEAIISSVGQDEEQEIREGQEVSVLCQIGEEIQDIASETPSIIFEDEEIEDDDDEEEENVSIVESKIEDVSKQSVKLEEVEEEIASITEEPSIVNQEEDEGISDSPQSKVDSVSVVTEKDEEQEDDESVDAPEEDVSKEESYHIIPEEIVSKEESFHIPEKDVSKEESPDVPQEEEEADMSAEVQDNLVVEDNATETEPLEDDSEDNNDASDRHIYNDDALKIEAADELFVKSASEELEDALTSEKKVVEVEKGREEEEGAPKVEKEEEPVSIIEDLAEDEDEDDEEGVEEEKEEFHQHLQDKSILTRLDKSVGEDGGVENVDDDDDDFYEDKFEEDVTATTEQSKNPGEEEVELPSVAEVVEEQEAEMEEESHSSKTNSSIAVATEPEVPFIKPPPPYSSLFKEKELDLPDQEDEEPQEVSSAKEVSQPSSGAQSSQIIDETSVAEEEEGEEEPDSSDKSSVSHEAGSTEKSKVPPADAVEVTAVTPESKPVEFDVPLKPPPPYYSPSSSLESTSLSSRSLILSLHQNKLECIARLQADLIWDHYSASTGQFPDIQSIMASITEKNVASVEGSGGDANQAAEQSFDVLLCHLIYETMKEVLLRDNKYTSFVEKVRPGPLALQARKLKVPKTKEALVDVVLKRVMKTIPQQFFSGDSPQLPMEGFGGSGGSRLRKWCSRPRELVDEILLEELIEEDYQWTEWWPEEVIVQNIVSTKIIQRLIRNVLKNRKYVYSHCQQSQPQD